MTKRIEKTTMEFKIMISGIEQHEDNKREYVKARLEDSIKKSSFEWIHYQSMNCYKKHSKAIELM